MSTLTSSSPWGHVSQGARYDASRYVTAAEIARNVRADIKAAQARGELPGKSAEFTYSVRSERFAGGQAVRIVITGPEGWDFRPATADDWQAREYGVTRVLTDDARHFGELLNRIGKSYTRSDVDSQTDYFNVSCYITVASGNSGASL